MMILYILTWTNVILGSVARLASRRTDWACNAFWDICITGLRKLWRVFSVYIYVLFKGRILYTYMYFFRLALSRKMNQSGHECSAVPLGQHECGPPRTTPSMSLIDHSIAYLIIANQVVYSYLYCNAVWYGAKFSSDIVKKKISTPWNGKGL